MQPLIRRTITITVTETWTITWSDGHETIRHKTQEMAWPAISEPAQPLRQTTDDDVFDPDMFDPNVADQTADDA